MLLAAQASPEDSGMVGRAGAEQRELCLCHLGFLGTEGLAGLCQDRAVGTRKAPSTQS